MSLVYSQEDEAALEDGAEIVHTPRPLHYLIELHHTAGPNTCGIYDISETLSKNLVVKYIEDAGPEATTGHEFYTLIPDLDYLPKERRLCNDEGQGHTLIFGKEGGWEKENEQVKFANFEDFSLDDEDEVQRELSSPFSMTIDCMLVEEICTRVMERVLDLKQLVKLNLSGCHLPDDMTYGMQFGGAYSLETLNLDWLKLRRIHPSMGRLRNLKDLSICYNRISDLPLTIRLLKNLRRLDITGNPFTRLPGAVFHLLGLEKLEGLNDCPLNKRVADGWQKVNQDISWRSPLAKPKVRENVDKLKEYCIQAAVGMDCWLLSLPERHCERLSKMAETQGLCENCLKSVRKLTVDHESEGYTIHAQMAVFCGVCDVPFTFMACSDDCLKLTVNFLIDTNVRNKKGVSSSRLPHCEYELEFVQDLEELRKKRAIKLATLTAKKAQGNPNRDQNRNYCTVL